MSDLGPQRQNLSYGGLLQVPGGITSVLTTVTDGDGNATPLQLSATQVSISGYVSATAENLLGGVPGAVVCQSDTDVTAFVNPGSAGQYLRSNGYGNTPTFEDVTPATIGALSTTGGYLYGPLYMSNQQIKQLSAPTDSTDAATKAYVDSVAVGLQVKTPARVATTANITLSGLQTIDGIVLVSNDRVLVKNQSLPQNNGVYLASASTWLRATDLDSWAEFLGAYVYVQSGTTNANSGWTCDASAGGTLGTTPIVWSQFSQANTYSAGSGLQLVGSTFSLVAPVSVANGGTGVSTITGVIKGNGTSAFQQAVAGTDYAPATSGSTILKGNGSGGFSSAVAGTDYSAPTTGTSAQLLANSGSGGFSNVTIGSGLSYTSGTLTATGAASSDFYNVKDYGAVGNGIANDTTAVQNAITAAGAAGGGIVFFPAGTYQINAALNCAYSGVSLQGVTQSNVISQSSAIRQTSLSSKILNITADFVNLDKLFLQYSSDASSGGDAIYVNGNSCTFTNFIVDRAYNGIFVNAKVSIFASQFQMTNCVFSGVNLQGSGTEGLAYGVFSDFAISAFNNGFAGGGIRLYNKVEGSQFIGGQTLSGQIGLYLGATTQSVAQVPAYNQFVGCVIDSATGAGSTANAYIACAYETDFVGCYFSGGRVAPPGTPAPGMYLNNTHALTFSGCNFFYNGSHGCVVSSSALNTSFTNCTFESNSASLSSGGAYGLVFATNAQKFQVNNCFAGCDNTFNPGQKQGYGIYINGGCDNFIVTGNNCLGNVTGGIYNAAGTGATRIVANNLT